MAWQDEQHWESDWWSNCANTFWEETKQIEYAKKMGIPISGALGKYPIYDFQAKRILDIGGGPVSMLLKAKEFGEFYVADPCSYPEWTARRYDEVGIKFLKQKGEDIDTSEKYDLVLIYNVLQHTDSPLQIIRNARQVAKVIKIFEWLETDITPGHPHSFTKDYLDKALGGSGAVELMNYNGCNGLAYFGTFTGEGYEIPLS